MRNLKKLLAVIVTIAMLATFAIPAFAAENEISADAEACADLGILLGDTGNGVTADYLAKETTRMQAAILTLRLFNLEDEAKAETSTENFADADEMVWEEGKAILAYLKANPELGWRGGDGGNFNPFDTISAQELYKVLLEALGYEQDVDFAWAEVFSFAEEKGLSKIADVENLTNDDLAVALMEVLALPLADGSMNLAAKLVAAGTIDKDAAIALGLVGDAVVSEIAAASAKSIKVTFAAPVVDTEKVDFSVKRGATAANVTVAWNEAKTEATLTQASNFAEATYTVTVSYDEKEIATKDIAFTQQKVAKIEFTSPSVAVAVQTGTGYVTYKVFDQYGNDITSSAMANGLTAQVGVNTSNLTIKNGLMEIDGADPDLITLQSLSVILYDSAAGVTATKNLPISTTVGTLSDFEFGSVDNVKLVEGDTTSVYYIPFTAKDMAGNETKSYDLVKGGLIDSDQNTSEVDLVVSLSNNVSAKVVKDPANSKNAAIEVKYINTSSYTMDMPVTITAMTYTGKSATVQTTLAKAKALDRVTLYAPANTVAVGENPEIPFEAYDAQGNVVTKFSDIDGKITANGFEVKEKSDGTAKFVMLDANTAQKGMTTLSAIVTKTGKMSNILTINVQEKAYPASIVLDSSKLVTAMESKAAQTIKFKEKDEAKNALRVYDQYDRFMDMTNPDNTSLFGSTSDKYYVKVTTSGALTVTDADGALITSPITTPANVKLNADYTTFGASGAVEFALYKKVAVGQDKLMDSASASISVIATKDIKSYTINEAKDAIYTVNDDSVLTDQELEYAFNAKVYGLTSAGTKVLLDNAKLPIVAAASSNAKDFTVNDFDGSFDSVKIVANKLTDSTKTSASTTLTVTVAHNNTVKPLTVAVTSSTTKPVAEKIDIKGAKDGVKTIKKSELATEYYLVPFYAEDDGAFVKGGKTESPFCFEIIDSYGTKGMNFSTFQIAKVWDNDGGSDGKGAYATDKLGVSVDTNGKLTLDTARLAAGDKIYVTAITNNGLSSTMVIEVTAN